MDTIAYFSYNPGGVFNKDNKGSISGSANFSGKSKEAREQEKAGSPVETPSSSPSAIAQEGVISDEEASNLAKKKLFRSGSVYTTALGDDITAGQLAGTRLT